MSDDLLVTSLVKKINDVVQMQHAVKVSTVKITLGAMTKITSDDLRKRLVLETRGTPVEGAHLDIEEISDWTDPRCQDITLERLELENS